MAPHQGTCRCAECSAAARLFAFDYWSLADLESEDFVAGYNAAWREFEAGARLHPEDPSWDGRIPTPKAA